MWFFRHSSNGLQNLPRYELPKCILNTWILGIFYYYFVWYDINNIYAFSVLKRVLSMVLHMQWVHHPSVCTPMYLETHGHTHTPRGCLDAGVPTLVQQFMSTLPFRGFDVVLTFCWHMQWVKLHCDTTLGTLIHSLYHTPRGVCMLVYPHWCSSSCLRCLSGVLRRCWPFVHTCNGWSSIVILP
jgi:hypothetical protein